VRVAVLTLVRDRLDYTQHCFGRLREFAGIDFDHYILDQGSTDGVSAWLEGEYRPHFLTRVPANIGISRGMNVLLASRDQDYDVVVKFDNDCELVQEFTLERVCDAVYETGALLSPVIRGLNHPPQPIREREMGSETILEIHQIGGIFLAARWVL
jgi:GT2 family glycosyltransferase